MQKLGIKQKINRGFFVLLALFLLSGIISLFELMRMRNKVSDLLLANVNNLTVSRTVLTLNSKMGYLAQSLVAGHNVTAEDELAELDSLILLLFNAEGKTDMRADMRDSLMRNIVDYSVNILSHLHTLSLLPVEERSAAYFSSVLPAYQQLRQQVNLLMDFHQKILVSNTKAVEGSRYRAAMPSIISTFAGCLLVLLFNYFILHFFVTPLLKIKRATENVIEYKAPFKVSIETNDEIGELKEAIAQLVIQARKTNKSE
ncbi:MAG: hypothetical protein ACRCSB_04810 [Bacteroidales bacterium]